MFKVCNIIMLEAGFVIQMNICTMLIFLIDVKNY